MDKFIELTEFATYIKVGYNMSQVRKIYRDSELPLTRLVYSDGTTDFVTETVAEINQMLSYGD